MIVTDSRGRPVPRPAREDYASDIAWLRADCVYRDTVHAMAARAFDAAFRKAVRR